MALDGSGHLSISWPCDCAAQKPILKTLITDIEAQDTLIRGYGKKQLQIFSANQPSLAQWQTLWLQQGNSLPLPNGVEFLWFDTSHNTYGAQYYSVNGFVYPVEMLRYRGLTVMKKDVTTTSNISTTLSGSGVGLLAWDLSDSGSGTPGAAAFIWTIPTQLLGKNYFVKFHVPYYPTMNTKWTIWYENTNFYNTLFGGAGNLGFGVNTPANVQNIVEWTAEIPAGGVVTTIQIRIAGNLAGGQVQLLPPMGSTGTVGRTSAEFILKTE